MKNKNHPHVSTAGTLRPIQGPLLSDPSKAISAEELVDIGSIDVLQRYLEASPDPDALRRELFMAAQNQRVRGADGKLKHVGLFGWPIVISAAIAMQAQSTANLIGKDEQALFQKMASIWSSALGNRNAGVSPLRLATHLDLLLGLSPLISRGCLNRGIQVLAGEDVGGWTFASKNDPKFKLANPGQTTTYIACAWVTWDDADPTPKFRSNSEAVARFSDMVRAMLCPEEGASATAVVVGTPRFLNEAVSDGLQMAINEVCRYATSIGRDFELEFVGEPTRSCVTTRAVIRELGAGTLSPEDRAMQWTYDTTWLLSNHQQRLCDALVQANQTWIAGRTGLMPLPPGGQYFRH